MVHALMLYNRKMGGVDLFDQFVATYRACFAQKIMVVVFFKAPQCCYGQCLIAVQENLQQKCHNACFYEENSRHSACFIETKKLSSKQYAQQASENLRENKFDQVIIKGQSKYIHCKVCKRRSVFLCQKM